jgi:hypothetical protein
MLINIFYWVRLKISTKNGKIITNGG